VAAQCGGNGRRIVPCRDISVPLCVGTNTCTAAVNSRLIARKHNEAVRARPWRWTTPWLSTPTLLNCGIPATVSADLAVTNRLRLAPQRSFGVLGVGAVMAAVRPVGTESHRV
jgi:hypothetical protein